MQTLLLLRALRAVLGTALHTALHLSLIHIFIAGMGELHLEIIVDRLLREYKVEANVGAPQVAYKETIKKSVEQDTKYARQSGGKGQYGHVRITVEPNESGKGYEFVNAVVGGAIPVSYTHLMRGTLYSSA